MDEFRISATGVSINYMPQYLAEELGYFRDVDLSVSSYVPSPWTQVLKDIDSGEYDAVVGGIWVPAIYNNRLGRKYRAFAKVASRCPLVLMARRPAKSFRWQDLENRVVLVSGGNGASPGLFLKGIAAEGGADVRKIEFVHDFTAAMHFELFQGGMGDYVLLKSDLAAELAALGRGYVAADLAVMGGPVPWSVYYGINANGELAGRFTLALKRATAWLLQHEGRDCEEILRRNWPKVAPQDGIEVVDAYRRCGMWDATVDIKKDELDRWQGFLVQGRVIDRPLAYGELVDSGACRYAEDRLQKA
ncbi:ABC transporter substrate-binding protein [Gehongia tenuis]|uniref:Thiamine pyrimidine synthase n=1 Tax=Gehongia tenuis TaxID=2763655 RepID=A0A926D5S6_9FIRM|nr:ABC transporter substrate-binding protein [Gehongia tenuis]MBC8530895.1 ABC transporter substrate-binding protein [Gehongia tenuis]